MSSTQSSQSLEPLPSYLTTELRRVRAAETPALMSGVGADGKREGLVDGTRELFAPTRHERQRYFVANRTRDIFRSANVHVPLAREGELKPPGEPRAQLDFVNKCNVALCVEKEFQRPRRYDICDHAASNGERGLLDVVMTGIDDVWNVVNAGLFGDIEVGVVVGKVHCIASVSSLFTFVPVKDVLPGVPRLEMQPAHKNGFGGYKLCVAGVPKQVGTINVERYYYDFELFNCTREESVLWLCILVAAELENRTPLAKFYTTQ